MPLRAIAFEAILSANCSTRAYPRGGYRSAIASGSCVRPRARTGGMERQPDRPRDWDPEEDRPGLAIRKGPGLRSGATAKHSQFAELCRLPWYPAEPATGPLYLPA